MRQAHVARKVQPRNSVVEQLEARRLLSTVLNAGVLSIVGTEGQDVVSVSEISGRIDVRDNGVITSFARNLVQKITFDGLFGGDKFEMQKDLAIPVEAWGGIGRDTLIGGAGNDTLWGGKGGDFLMGNNGADLLRGALGDDKIIAGGKIDIIYGGEGNDTINTGAGNDVVYDTLGTNSIDSGDASLVVPFSTPMFRSEAFLTNVSGYDPNQIRLAYNYGDYDPNAGTGQTIYIVDAFTGRDVLGDFQVFSAQFDLPMPVLGGNFEIVNASGRTPAVNSLWAGEINLDVQWAHAVAPGAKIVLVQADSDLWSDISEAIRVAADMSEASGGGIVSMSLGTPQDDFYFSGLDSIEQTFRTHSKTSFIAASGDNGGIRSYPSTSPYVTSVGGTALFVDQEGVRNGEEAAWVEGGGGLTSNFATPSYQRPLGLPSRGVPDVAYNADPATAVAVYLTTPQGGDKGWFSIGGTSAGAPQWAGIVARINQTRLNVGQPVIGANLNGAMYQIYHDGLAYDDSIPEPGFIKGGFNDILVGSAGINPARTGYDLATGIGTPNVSVLVSQLTRTDNFFFTNTFEFSGEFFLPLDTFGADTSPDLSLYAAQGRNGKGIISGSDTVVLDFVTEPSRFQDPLGESTLDQYDVELYRTRDGRIYGRGFALINNVNNVGPFTVTFVLDFEGSWTMDANGETHVYIKYFAVDPITGAAIPKSQFSRSVFDANYGGAWYGGKIEA